MTPMITYYNDFSNTINAPYILTLLILQFNYNFFISQFILVRLPPYFNIFGSTVKILGVMKYFQKIKKKKPVIKIKGDVIFKSYTLFLLIIV